MEVLMEIRDWVLIATAVISLNALIVSWRNRKLDIDREKAFQIRARVWDILNGDAGSRSISALDQSDGKTENRIKLLRRTADQLKIAGELTLGGQLESLLGETWPKADEKSRKAREDFYKAVAVFMQKI
jgi:hypothetical protein